MALLNDFPRQKLREIIVDSGVSVTENRERCRALLLDYIGSGSYRQEINVLMAVLEEQVVDDLLHMSTQMPLELYLIRLEKRVHENRAINEQAARWGVEAWAFALGIDVSEVQKYEEIDQLLNKSVQSEQIVGRSVDIRQKAQPQTGINKPSAAGASDTDHVGVREALTQPPASTIESEQIVTPLPDEQKAAHPPISTTTVSSPGEPTPPGSLISTHEPRRRMKRSPKEYAAGGCTQVLYVSKKVSGKQNGIENYTTISEAIMQAAPGACIYVFPDRYQEQIVIRKNLRIIGQGPIGGGPEERVIVESYTLPCISMRTSGAAEVHNLTLRGYSARHNTVDITRGRLLIQDCTISSSMLACISISGLSANPTIEDCILSYSRGWGVLVDNGSNGKLIGCSVFDDRSVDDRQLNDIAPAVGVEIRMNSNLTISGGEIHTNRGNGVLIHSHGTATIEDECIIRDNVLAGVEVRNHGSLRISGSKIYSNHLHGVYLHENSTLTILGGAIYSNQRNGVHIHEHGKASIEKCKIHHNARAGVQIVQGDNDLSLKGCEIYEGDASGILILGTGKGRTTIEENCQIKGNAYVGIEIRHDGDHLISGCNISEGNALGILCGGTGTIIVDKCTIYDNENHGVEVKSGSVLLRNTMIERNKYYGIVAPGPGKAELDQKTKDGLKDNKDGMWPPNDEKRIEYPRERSSFLDRLYFLNPFHRLRHQ